MSIEPDAPPHPADTGGLHHVGGTDRPTAVSINSATPVTAMASQATAIEATRAVAEVQALVTAARALPRIRDVSVALMREACDDPEVFNRAFWTFNRGRSKITGPTVHLMTALALAWQNVTYGRNELRRDEINGYSEMQAWAWDLERNVRVADIFTVPHRRDKDGGRSPLDSDRDITDNNSNQASRKMREAIRKVLPPWFVAEAKERCTANVTGDPSVPLPRRIADAVARFGDEMGVKPDQLEAWLDAGRNDWTVFDLARLKVVYGEISRGEKTARAEFPHRGVTGEEIVQQAATAAQLPPAGNPEPVQGYDPEDPERPFD